MSSLLLLLGFRVLFSSLNPPVGGNGCHRLPNALALVFIIIANFEFVLLGNFPSASFLFAPTFNKSARIGGDGKAFAIKILLREVNAGVSLLTQCEGAKSAGGGLPIRA